MVGERQLREQQAILCFDVREAEREVGVGDADLDGAGPDLPVGLHQPEPLVRQGFKRLNNRSELVYPAMIDDQYKSMSFSGD